MFHKYFADDMAEAEAIIARLEVWHDNYSGQITRHNLLVSWLDETLDEYDWAWIEEEAEDIRAANAIHEAELV